MEIFTKYHHEHHIRTHPDTQTSFLNRKHVTSYTEVYMNNQVRRILCIEDDTFLLNLISGKFTEVGIQAIGAHGGIEGVVLASSVNPDLILLDLMLPDILGLDVLDKLKADDKTKHIPVIIFSNLGARAEIEAGIAHGATSYLVKSNTLPGELVETISKELDIVSPEVSPIIE